VRRWTDDGGLQSVTCLSPQSGEFNVGGLRDCVDDCDCFTPPTTGTAIAGCREVFGNGAGMYARAERGELKAFPGVSAPYEPPEAPDLVLATNILAPDDCALQVLALLRARGVLLT